MEPIGTIGEEILGNLIATLHPGQTPLPSHLKTFERNPISRACISDRSYNNYYFGALQGGKTEHFLKMCETLKGWIEDDLNKNYIPVYHDESMINKYFMDNPPDRVLGREYAYVEKWFGKPNNQVKIVCIEKDNDKMRKG
jgi:histo-blood group ABO system transferase